MDEITQGNCNKITPALENKSKAIKTENLKVKEVLVQTNKDDNIIFKCEICFKKYSTRPGLIFHNNTVHKGICYPCNQCSHKATQKSQLKVHINAVHEGVRYKCKYCDYKATDRTSFKKHNESSHMGIRYPCELILYYHYIPVEAQASS